MLIHPKIHIVGSLQNLSKGLHLIRSFSHQIHPTHSLQTLHVTRTIPPILLKFNEHKFTSPLTYRNISIYQLNKLTMLSAWVLNLSSNSFQLGGYDTTQLDKSMTKDTTNISQLGQSSQHTRPGPSKPQESLNRRRTRYGPEYLLFFFLIFL